MPKLRSVPQNGGKTPIYFFYFWFKKTSLSREIGKKRKKIKSKNIQVAGYYPNITLVFLFFIWKIKIIYYKNSDFCRLLRLCAISALQISKKHFVFFKKWSNCVNCGTLNATNLTWLLSCMAWKWVQVYIFCRSMYLINFRTFFGIIYRLLFICKLGFGCLHVLDLCKWAKNL